MQNQFQKQFTDVDGGNEMVDAVEAPAGGLPVMPSQREASSIRTLLMLKLVANQQKNKAMQQKGLKPLTMEER